MDSRYALGTLDTDAVVVLVRSPEGGWGLHITSAQTGDIAQAAPVRLELYREGQVRPLAVGYDTVERTAEGLTARATVADGGAAFGVEDRWRLQGAVLSVARSLRVQGDAPGGFNSAIMLGTAPQVTWPDLDFLAPGLLYGDPTHDGDRSPGGTLHYLARRFAIREDYLAAPLFACSWRNGASLAALHLAPEGDTNMEETRAEAGTTLIDARYQFGALGAREATDGGVELGFWLPGSVEDIPNREGAPERLWRRRYHPIRDGLTQAYTVAFRFGQGESCSQMTRNSYRWAWQMLQPKVTYLDVEVARRALTDHLAERVTTIEGRTGIPFIIDTTTGRIGVQRCPFIRPRPPSPRTSQPASDVTWWSWAIMGFVGKNIEAADQLLREGDRDETERGARMRRLGLAIIDSFIRLVPMSPPRGSGFNIVTGEISMTNPQYHEWFLRAPAEDMRMLMEAYRREQDAGRDHPEWLAWCRAFADWAMAQQREDGSFPRSWHPDTGEVIESSGTTSYNPVPLFVKLSAETSDPRYLESALRAAEYVWASYGVKGVFVGGAIDNPNIVDKEAGMLSLEAFLALYEATQAPKWLRRAQVAADYAETWIWLWDVPMPEDADDADLHWKKGVPTTGLQGITARVAGHLDEYMDWSTAAYARLYVYTQDPHYLDVARLLLHNTKAMLALPDRTYDLLGPGWQQEHWRMGPDTRGFGGHRSWLPWVSTNHLYSITGLEAYDRDLFERLSKPER